MTSYPNSCLIVFAAFAAAPHDDHSSRVTSPENVLIEKSSERATAAAIDPPTVLPIGVDFGRVVVTSGGAAEFNSADVRAEGETRVVYSNRLGQYVYAPVPGILVADDVATTAAHGCQLDRYAFRVLGDAVGNGEGKGSFSVDFALYDTRPGSDPIPIAGTSGHVDFPDNGTYDVEFQVPPGEEISIPTHLYFGIVMSRPHAGIVVGAPALSGFSADRFDFPGTACLATFAGFPGFPHASFDLELHVRGDCGFAYPGYKNECTEGELFSSQPLSPYFADDITLAAPGCDMIAYEVGFRGQFSSSSGAVQATLHTGLLDEDPENGLAILESRQSGIISGTEPTVLRKEFDPPIPLPQDLWIVYKTQNSFVGAIRNCLPEALGSTDDMFAVHFEGAWFQQDAPASCLWIYTSAFDITITCAGEPAVGACCDILLTEDQVCLGGQRQGDACRIDFDCGYCLGREDEGNRCNTDNDCSSDNCIRATCVGDAVCRQVPEMNCASSIAASDGLGSPGLLEHWQEGQPCESLCVGGQNDGMACTRQADCPNGSCPGPFPFSCGVAGCCTPADTCERLTKEQCVLRSLPDEPVFWNPSNFCTVDDFPCPFHACLNRAGECCAPHPAQGCEDPFCCTDVCRVDSYCCESVWDEICVELAADLCDYRCDAVCPPTKVAWVDPPDAVVDARLPHRVDSELHQLGIDSIVVEASVDAADPVCWTLCETEMDDIPNQVFSVDDNKDGTLTLNLARPITVGAITTITYSDDEGGESTGTFTSHPGNVDGNGQADSADVTALIDVLNGATEPTHGLYSTDCNHSESTTPQDLLCQIDLLNGADALSPGWNESSAPAHTGRCPRLCGGSGGAVCGATEFCEVADGDCCCEWRGVCTASPNPADCPKVASAVCGCDGLTYDNECLADAAGVSVDHSGSCLP